MQQNFLMIGDLVLTFVSFTVVYLISQQVRNRETGTATSVSFDLGFMWRPTSLIVPFTDYDLGNKFSIGLNLSNLGPKISYIDRAQADPIPTQFRLGLAYRILSDDYNSLTYTLDFTKLLVRRYADGNQ
jgi:hypothetical protein